MAGSVTTRRRGSLKAACNKKNLLTQTTYSETLVQQQHEWLPSNNVHTKFPWGRDRNSFLNKPPQQRPLEETRSSYYDYKVYSFKPQSKIGKQNVVLYVL